MQRGARLDEIKLNRLRIILKPVSLKLVKPITVMQLIAIVISMTLSLLVESGPIY